MSNNFATIQETFTLPSKGLIYNGRIGDRITLRSMTTRDEMLRLSPSDNAFESLCNLIDNCIISEDFRMSSYDLCIGDYVFLLYRLRAVTYGETYHCATNCPFCGSYSEHDISLDELEIKEYDEETINKYRQFILPVSGKEITLKFQTPRILDNIEEKVKEFKRKHKEIGIDNRLVYTLVEIIDLIDGKNVDSYVVEEWIKNLSMKDTNIILQNATELNACIGLNTSTKVGCRFCGLDYEVKTRADMEFFRPALG